MPAFCHAPFVTHLFVIHLLCHSLGVLVCTMEPGTIIALHPSILEHLKLCPMLTGAQQDAVNAVLLRGSTVYG